MLPFLMRMNSVDAPLVINGWSIYCHPLFLAQLEGILEQVENLKQKQPKDFKKKNATKRFAAIVKLIQDIPQDPTRTEYRQGSTLGKDHKHWFRAKFFQQYRLFFRYHMEGKIIIFAWVNDEKTKRAYGSKTDAYRVFQSMIERGSPPDDWDALLEEAKRSDTHFVNLSDKTSILNDGC